MTYNKFKIGVFGSAAGLEISSLKKPANRIGEEIAKRNGILLTGACPGIPLLAAYGAKFVGGTVIGFSPAIDLQEHIDKFKFPVDPHDILIFTGMEKKGRNIICTRTCDAAIFICGRIGTMNEFTLIYDEGNENKVIGFLRGTGGVVDGAIRKLINETEKKSKVKIIYDKDPAHLVSRIFKQLENNLKQKVKA